MGIHWKVPPQDAIVWSVNILLAKYWALPKEDQVRMTDLLHSIRADQPQEEAVATVNAIVEILDNSANFSSNRFVSHGTMPMAKC